MKNLKWIKVSASVVSLTLASLMVAGCSGGSDSGSAVEKSPEAQSSQPREGSMWLWPRCGQRAESPGLDVIEVDVSGSGRGLQGGVSADESGLNFGIVLDNQTDLVAVGIGYSLRFIGDGEDVTDQLGGDFKEHWNGGVSKVDIIGPKPFSFGDSIIEKPDGWEDMDLELEVEVTGVDYWCTYEDPGPYSG